MSWRGHLIVDGHMDTPLRLVDEGLDLGARHSGGHADLPRLRAGGVDAVFLAAWIDPDYAPDRALARAESLLGAIREAAERHPEVCALAGTASDARRCAEEGRVALLAGVENGDALEGRLENLERLYALGARYMTLTWMNSNDLGDAAGGDEVHGGLSDFGREVVRSMGRMGMMVDVAHVAPSTFRDALEAAEGPVVVSHAATEVRGPHPRNVSDDQIRAIADADGVVGIAFMPRYLSPTDPGAADVTVIVDHVDRVVEFGGIDCAALGSDLDGVPALPRGIKGAQSFPRVAREIERRGYSSNELAKILGGNWLRVLERLPGSAG